MQESYQLNNNTRQVEFDLVRGICILYIIGIWHLNEYINPVYHFSGTILQILHKVTEIVLATFTFISGYFLSKYNFNTIKDVIDFYKKRFIRFGILLLLSSLSFYFLGWIDFSQIILIVLGINMFTTNITPTLWFFSMIILFYLFTPIMRIGVKYNTKVEHLILTVFIYVFFIIAVYFYHSDYRLILYFPVYYIGLNFNKLKRCSYNVLLFYALIISSFLLLASMYYNLKLIELALLISSVLFLVSFLYLTYNKRYNRIIEFVSYSSMSAYLFHRQILSAVRQFTGLGYIPIHIALITIIMIFVISYYIQKGYDYFINYYYGSK